MSALAHLDQAHAEALAAIEWLEAVIDSSPLGHADVVRGYRNLEARGFARPSVERVVAIRSRYPQLRENGRVPSYLAFQALDAGEAGHAR